MRLLSRLTGGGEGSEDEELRWNEELTFGEADAPRVLYSDPVRVSVVRDFCGRSDEFEIAVVFGDRFVAVVGDGLIRVGGVIHGSVVGVGGGSSRHGGELEGRDG